MKVALQIDTIDGNSRTSTRKYSDMSTTAKNSELKSFAMALVNLTDRSFAGAYRIETTDVDDPDTEG